MYRPRLAHFHYEVTLPRILALIFLLFCVANDEQAPVPRGLVISLKLFGRVIGTSSCVTARSDDREMQTVSD